MYTSTILRAIHVPGSVLWVFDASTGFPSRPGIAWVGVVCVLIAAILLFFGRPFSGPGPTRARRLRSEARFRAGAIARIAGALVLVIFAGALITTSYAEYHPGAGGASGMPSTGTGSGQEEHGAVSVVAMPGEPGQHVPESQAWVYTPPGYDGSGPIRYPVLYLIHGYPGTASDWFSRGHLGDTMDAMRHQGLIVPMIVVSLDIHSVADYDTECLDSSDGPKVESWLYSRAVPHIDKTYSTQADRAGRMLGGFSAGGFCALDQGLRHQEIWGIILAFEGFGEPGTGGEAAFGGNLAEIKAHSPEEYIPTLAFTHPQAFYMDSGDGSGLERVKRLAEALTDRGQDVYHRVNHGEGHSWAEVRAGLPYALAFASRELPPQDH